MIQGRVLGGRPKKICEEGLMWNLETSGLDKQVA